MINFSGKWDEIDRASRSSTSIRVVAEHKLNLFVAFSSDEKRQLKLRSATPVFDDNSLPAFENIDINLENDSAESELCITLVDNSLKDLFCAIAEDLVYASSVADTEAGAAHIFANRLARWAELLEERKNRGLTLAQQIGLLGELHIIKKIISDGLASATTAITGWRGPSGDTRDINLGCISIEVKASLGTSKLVLHISSLDQLDTVDRQLTISHYRFSPSDSGISLAMLIENIEYFLKSFPYERNNLWRKLFLVGYDRDANYVNNTYEILEHTFYEVRDDFPRLTPGSVPAQIRAAKYEIDCGMLIDYEIDGRELENLIRGRS